MLAHDGSFRVEVERARDGVFFPPVAFGLALFRRVNQDEGHGHARARRQQLRQRPASRVLRPLLARHLDQGQRIDDERADLARPCPRERRYDVARLPYPHPRERDARALGRRAHLGLAHFGRQVERITAERARHALAPHERARGFADPRRAGDEQHRARDRAAIQCGIERPAVERDARGFLERHRIEPPRLRFARRPLARAALSRRRRDPLQSLAHGARSYTIRTRS